MHTTFTATIARDIVNDRIREAEHSRLAHALRSSDAEPAARPQRPAGAGWTRRFRRFRIAPAA
jgi:hypothetical protein